MRMWFERVAAGKLHRVAAGLQQHDMEAGFSQPGGDRSTARARTDDDVVA